MRVVVVGAGSGVERVERDHKVLICFVWRVDPRERTEASFVFELIARRCGGCSSLAD